MTAIVKFKLTCRVANSALLAACRTVSVWSVGGHLVDQSPGPLYCIIMLPPSVRAVSEGSKQAKLYQFITNVKFHKYIFKCYAKATVIKIKRSMT